MNTYFSKTERDMFLKLDMLLGMATEVLRTYEKTPNADKDFMKFLKTGRTYLEKALVRRYLCLDPKEAQRFRRSVSNYKYIIVPSDIARANDIKLQKEQDTLAVGLDDFQDWYDGAIPYICGVCPFYGDEESQKVCKMRKFMEKYDIYPVNTHATGNICQYDYKAAGISIHEWEKDVRDGKMDMATAQEKLAELVEQRV